jgi:DUF1707 SHOCT-like domain
MARRSALRRSRLRASEADRDLVAERLRDATVEGRLLAEELDTRLGVALSARTYGELAPLVADLPGPRSVVVRDTRGRIQAVAITTLTILLAAVAAVAWHRW